MVVDRLRRGSIAELLPGLVGVENALNAGEPLEVKQGLIKFDERGDARVPAHVLQFRDGAYHLVK